MYIDVGLYLPQILAAAGIFLGCFSRMIFPFLKKRAKAQGELKWEGRYIWTFAFTFVGAVIATMFFLPQFEIPASGILPLAFIEGWGLQDFFNKIAT